MKLLICVLFILCGCGKIIRNPLAIKIRAPESNTLLGLVQVKLLVFYEPGAEPYIDDGTPIKYWEILHQNLTALFQNKISSSAIKVPKELSEMKILPSQAKAEWSAEEVLNLANAQAASETGSFRILFVKGHSKEGTNIIGFQIRGTNVIVIFKDVIRSVANDSQLISNFADRYVEQATLVHEMGHALGLVNNGLPLTSPHHDSAHGAHCDSKDCVMFWENEGLASMIKFAQKAAANLSVIMYDKQCLKDAQSYIPSNTN